MPRIPIPFATGFYQSDSLPLSHQQAINCFPSIPEAPALGQETLFPSPGLVQLVANQGSTNEVNRGAHVMNGVPYFVNGTTLYRLDRSGSPGSYTYNATDLGTISGSGRVSMADNGSQLCVLVPGGDGYILTTESSFGSNMVLNGDFDTDTDWTKGTGWTIAYGVATCAAGTTAGTISQAVGVTATKTYKVTYDVTIGSGTSDSFTIAPSIGGTAGTTVNAAGTYTEEITAATTDSLVFTCTTDATTSVNIDNVVVQEEDPASLKTITDADFRASGDPQYVVFIDGYFVFTTDSKKFIVSALNDGLVYNALDFGSAEADPDDIVCPIVLNNQLFIAGSQTIEAYQNIGGADFPFQRTGVFISKGVVSPLSAIQTNQTFMFIGAGENEEPAVYELVGNGVRKVSTIPVDKVLQDLTDTQLDSVFAWTYAQNGHFFIGFVLPETVLVYDTISQRWHERKSEVNSQTVRWRVNSTVQAYGLILAGDSVDGRVGYLDPDTATEYGDEVKRRFTTPPIHNNAQSFFMPRVELTVESGVGLKPTVSSGLLSSVKSWWTFDSTSWADSVGGNQLVLYNAASPTPSSGAMPELVTGSTGTAAANLDIGIVMGPYFKIDNTSTGEVIVPYNESFTLSGRFKLSNTVSGIQGVWGIGVDDEMIRNSAISLEVDDDALNIRVTSSDGGTALYSVQTGLSAATWYHFAIVHDVSIDTVYVYVDSVLKQTIAMTAPLYSVSEGFLGALLMYIGTRYSNSRLQFSGVVDEFVYRSSMMTTSEMTEEAATDYQELTTPAAGVAPKVTMRVSKNGKTWSNGRSREVGREGEYEKRVVWRRNGRFPRMAVLRFDMTDPVRYVVMQLFADIEGEDG